jgi:hypothetical protein
MKINFKLRALMILTVLCFSSICFAQNVTISPNKKKVIAEIVSVTKADQSVKEVMQSMFKQMNASYPLIIKGMTDKRTDLTPAQKAKIENDLINKRTDFEVRFQQKIIQAINFQEYVEATIYPLYDKYFTETELNDLLTFYKTPTGQKLNAVLPQLSAEGIRLSQEYLIPKINGIVEEVLKEQTQPTAPQKVNK